MKNKLTKGLRDWSHIITYQMLEHLTRPPWKVLRNKSKEGGNVQNCALTSIHENYIRLVPVIYIRRKCKTEKQKTENE